MSKEAINKSETIGGLPISNEVVPKNVTQEINTAATFVSSESAQSSLKTVTGENVGDTASFNEVTEEAKQKIKELEAGTAAQLEALKNNEENPTKIEILKLLKAGQKDEAAELFDKLEVVDGETATAFVNAGFNRMIAHSLDRVKGANGELIVKLIDAGEVRDVLLNSGFIRKSLSNNDLNDIAGRLIELNHLDLVNENLDTFFAGIDTRDEMRLRVNLSEIPKKIDELENKSENLKKYIKNLVEERKENTPEDFINKLGEETKKEDPKKTQILDLLKSGNKDGATELFDTMEVVDNETATKFAEAGFNTMIARNLNRVKGTSAELVIKLIDAGEARDVLLNSGFIKKFLTKNEISDIAGHLIETGNLKLVQEHSDDLFAEINKSDKLLHEMRTRMELAGIPNEISHLKNDVSKLYKEGIADLVAKRKKASQS